MRNEQIEALRSIIQILKEDSTTSEETMKIVVILEGLLKETEEKKALSNARMAERMRQFRETDEGKRINRENARRQRERQKEERRRKKEGKTK